MSIKTFKIIAMVLFCVVYSAAMGYSSTTEDSSTDNLMSGMKRVNAELEMQTGNTEKLIQFVRKADRSEKVLSEIVLLEASIYKEFKEITERMKAFTYLSSRISGFNENEHLRMQFSKASSGYMVLSSKYSELLDSIVVYGKGIELKKNGRKRYLAFMVENHNRARPQNSTSLAEVFYEVPAEGGITRYMLLFPQDDKYRDLVIGPIRSCREYFLDILDEYNAVYIHCGASKLAYDYISERKVSNIDELQTRGGPFHRSEDRKPPHNLYINYGRLMDYLNEKKKDYLVPESTFPHEFTAETEGVFTTRSCSAVNINLVYTGKYNVTYVYNSKDGLFYRFIKEDKDIDLENGKQLTARNIAVQFAKMKVVDKLLRLKMDLIGEGDGYLFKEGRGVQCTWRKADRFSPTEYYVGDQKIRFTKGRIDILIMDEKRKEKCISIR